MTPFSQSASRALRVALFGAGGYGSTHARILGEDHAAGRVKFVAVADPTGDKLPELKSRLAASGVRWFDDYRELLDRLAGHLDAIVICTPIPLHLPMLEAALDHGLAVLLEKPPVPLIQDFLRINARPEARRVAVAFQRIAEPNLWTLQRALRDGSLGRIERLAATACWPRNDAYYGRAGWAGRMVWNDMPVLDGPATNALAHIIHHLMFLAGDDGTRFAMPESLRAELYRARPIETYDLVSLRGQWASGVGFSAAFTHACANEVDWSIVVEGDRGRARLGPGLLAFETDPPLPSAPGDDDALPRACWDDFYYFATGAQSRPLTSFADCHAYLATANAMFLSSGRIHTLPSSIVRRNSAGVCEVSGIEDLIAATARTGKTFSELGAEWALPGCPVNPRDVTEFSPADGCAGER